MKPDHVPGASGDLDLFGPRFQDNPSAVYEQLRYNASFMVRGLLEVPVRVRRRPAG
jgi:hypothetical protein